jgi:hypothetical protein
MEMSGPGAGIWIFAHLAPTTGFVIEQADHTAGP